ncbi:hypothetical protein GCM10007049_13560 [Echinicola pacifica]|uniref:Choline/glycine/proline betaine transport protein n=1 Tax=Echinicola pacifica TaxID=346377 RepID=A0A918UMX7_9BACT|nr:BCCT family transporter [Echinicola pacifica]GGZ22064.1 hypothetical protein GCM10007049_13560 [Echinicola pacifica]
MNKKYFDVHAPVFWPASILIVIFIAITLVVGEPMEQIFTKIQFFITDKTGWLFILSINAFIIFCIYLAFSKYGKIRLGGKNAETEFSTSSWFAMLFSAGMGIGLLFWGVAEPVTHYAKPPVGEAFSIDAAERAMSLTFMHWGFHAWAIYAVVALALAFFTFNRKLPLTIRSIFYPILGDRIYGWIGDAIDVMAVLATLFGLATSLGFGVRQINGGLFYLFEIPISVPVQVMLISGITVLATISVFTGLDKGVKILSEWNVRIAGLLLIFVVVAGPSLYIFRGFIQNLGIYLNNFITVSTWTEAYAASEWQGSWTVFYWAWWVSWSPFVGMFIARISRGRTVREFIAGVLIVPALLTFFWLTAMGGSAIYMDMQMEGHAFAKSVIADEATALFVFLHEFPMAKLGSGIGVILVMSFFVTSSDSGSLVIDSITAGGKLDAPVGQRIFWALTEGAVAAALLIGGGLSALQTATITTGLPFLIILLIMCYSLYRGLQKEHARNEALNQERDKKSYEENLARIIKKNIEKGK